MAGITGASASRIFTFLLPVFIVISASPPQGAFPGDQPCKAPPPRLVNGGYNRSLDGRFATYHCDDYFRLKGPWQLVCIASPYAEDTWVPDPQVPHEKYPDKPECHRACDDFEVEHGRLSGERSGGTFFAPGDRAFVECDPGFRVNGTDQLLCQDDGSWDQQPPTCTVEGACDDFQVEHGRLSRERSGGTFFAPGDRAFVECDPGFRVNGTDQLLCQDGGSWDQQPPTCIEGAYPGDQPCKAPPPRLVNGGYTRSPDGRFATYHCDDHFWLKGPGQVVCIASPYENDTWVPDPGRPQEKYLDKPECHPLTSPVPSSNLVLQECQEPKILKGSYNGDCCNPGNEVQFFCAADHYALSGVTNATCLPNGTWSGPLPVCKALRACQEPKIDRGGYHGKCCAPEDEVQFYCNGDRYALFGVKNATCLPDGTWSAPLPVCKDTYCKDTGRSSNGKSRMVLNGTVYKDECCPPGTEVQHVCDEGYELVGERILRCGTNGTWNHAMPKCKRKPESYIGQTNFG